MTTDANGKQPLRASTRNTRATQERKELLDAAQVRPRVAASDSEHEHAHEKSDINKETASAPASVTTSTAVDEPAASTGGDQTSAIGTTRRSGRRSATTAPAAPTKLTTGEEKAGNTQVSTTETESTGTKTAVDAQAVAACVASGVSLSTTATRFGISRTEVAKIVKETTVENASSDSTAPAPATDEITATTTTAATATAVATELRESVASDVSTETTTDSDGVSSRRGATTNKRGTREEEEVDAASGALSRATKATKDSSAESVSEATEEIEMSTAPESAGQTVAPPPPVLAIPAAFTYIPNDHKRNAEALADGSDGAPGSGGIMPKAKRVRKTREEKLAILAFVDDGGTHVAAAEKYGVSRTAVTKMVKERDIIMSGLSGKQHAAANGTPQSMVAALAGTYPFVPASMDHTGTPPARKTRTASNTSTSSTTAGGGARSLQPGDSVINPKAKRVRKTNEEKLLILEFVERGGSQGAAAEKFGVSRTAVTKMVKEREAITAQVRSGKSNHRKVLQYQHKLSIIEDMLYKWQVQVENDAPNLKITGDLLQSKAVEFRDKILAEWKQSLEPEVVQSLSDFKASNGWLHRYLQRRNLRTASKREYNRRPNPNGNRAVVVPGSPSDPFNMNLLLADLAQRLRTVPVQCIWNMDEVALLPKACVAPSAKEGEAEPDIAVSDRMTTVLMVNAAGEKFKPEVLISDAYVEKLDTLQKAHPNLILTSQHHAWQDTTTLALYLHTVSTEAKLREETWFVVMDASPSHIEFAQLVDPTGSFEQGYRFESLVLLFLPPQASTEQQPLHHGIARVFKAGYRQAMLAAIVQKWNEAEGTDTKPSFSVHAQISAAEEMAWLSAAWDAVPAALIRHCWVRTGLLSPAQLAQISQDNSRAVEAELFRSLTDTMSLLTEQDSGALAQCLGLAADASGVEAQAGAASSSSSSLSILDRVNALITLDDNEATERKVELSSANNQVITETDANGDLRALV